VATTAISNQQGNYLVVLTSSSRVCVPITSSAFTLAPTAMTDLPASGNPCDTATAETTFAAGPQSVSFGVFVGGQTTPLVSTPVQVTVAGDVIAPANGALLSAGDAGAAGPGRIFVATTAISNQQGKYLVVLTSSSRVCMPITSNAFTLAPTAMTDLPASGNPCDTATAETTFAAGPQSVSFGVFVGGQTTPLVSTPVQVTVAGDVIAPARGALLSQ
jgi:hypothetical protein